MPVPYRYSISVDQTQSIEMNKTKNPSMAFVMKITKFAGDAAGLEKMLRLIQSITQIVAAYSHSTSAAAPWLLARKQLALGRRYLRVLKFTDAFVLAFACFGAKAKGKEGLRKWLEFAKWSCLGSFLGLESVTLLDTMGVYPTKWAGPVFVEAMKFWFYSICISMLLSVMDLWELQNAVIVPTKTSKEITEKPGLSEDKGAAEAREAEMEARRVKRRAIVKKLIGDAADLFTPGTVTGWMPTSMANVGWMGVVSTLLGGVDVWIKVQAC